MLSLKAGIEDLKQAKTLMNEANHIMSDHVSKLKALEDENAKLKAKLESTCMELPLDADGVPIRIGDKMDVYGDAMTVIGYRLYDGELLLVVKKAEGDFAVYTPKPSSVRHYKYSKTDSWERLEGMRRNSPVSISAWTEPLRRATTARMDLIRLAAHAGRTPAST